VSMWCIGLRMLWRLRMWLRMWWIGLEHVCSRPEHLSASLCISLLHRLFTSPSMSPFSLQCVQQELQQESVCVQQASVCAQQASVCAQQASVCDACLVARPATRPATREMPKDRSCNKRDATRKELQQEQHPHAPPLSGCEGRSLV